MDADFSVKITVRNGRLLGAIRRKYGTVANMARLTGISQTVVGALLTMKYSPVHASGDWKKVAYDVSSALHMEPEEIWPAHVAKIKIKRNEAEFDMSLDDVRDMLAPGNYGPAMKALSRWTKNVNPRGMKVLIMEANGATMDEMGRALGVSKERARQLSEKAKRHIRTAAAKQGVTSTEDVKL